MNINRAIGFLRRVSGFGSFPVREHFRRIYEENLFGGAESRSGRGSSLVQTERLRQILPALLIALKARRFLDAPCGDCRWIAELNWEGCEYIGVDVVPDLIEANRRRLSGRPMEFRVADLCSDKLPLADVVFCRDCWVHLDFRQIRASIRNFARTGATYLCSTTFTAVQKNRDLRSAIWRPLNLQLPPFCFPPPRQLLVEGCSEDAGKYADKSIGVWAFADLPEQAGR